MSLALAVTYELLRFRGVSTTSAELALKAARTRVAAPVPARLQPLLSERSVSGRAVYDVTPAQPSGTRLVYLHGGCYLYPIQSAHWGIIASLVESSGVTVTLPLYGLAPDHTVDEAYALLDALEVEVEGAWLAGDSAGGGLALGHAMRLRDGGTPAAGVILISPWVDVTLENPAIPELQKTDRMLATPGLIAAGQLWAGSHDPRDPLVSPLFGDLGGLPPVHVFQGGRDILAADARLLVEGIHAAGGAAELEFVDKAFHDYPGAPWMPEARRALRRMAQLLS